MAKQKTPPDVPSTSPPEGYTVLARRYRPQQLAEVIGQEHVARALENALKGNRVAHAYLFTGARGVGKTSTARILAKALNCEKGPTVNPCGQCAACVGIATGEDVDVVEIDGASNNKVDEVRELRSNVQYRPARARHKIYIIDEVHMLSPAAFNALLKTLEEPPPHVKFIFATTEVQKIPVTILSRCQRFDFAGIGIPQIIDRLRDIVQREGMQADDEALEMVARRAQGSMRDAQSLLDQLLAFGNDKLTADQVHALLGTAGDDRVVELASAVLDRDPKRALDFLAALAEKSLQFGELLDQLIAYWRDLMVVRCAGDEARDLSVPARHRDTLKRQASALGLDTILAGLDVLNGARTRLKTSNHGRMLVEMALVRLGRLDDLVSLSQLTQWLGQGGPAPVSTPPSSRVAPRGDYSGAAVPPEGLKKKSLTAAEPTETDAPMPLTAETVSHVWQRVLDSIGPLFASHLEKAAIPAIFGPNTLVLRFPSDYNDDRDFCQEPARLARIEQTLERVSGKVWTVRVEGGGQPPGSPPSQTPRAQQDPEGGGLTRARRLKEAAEEEPLIKRAMEVLGARVVRVDEGFNPPAAAPDEAEAGPERDSEET